MIDGDNAIDPEAVPENTASAPVETDQQDSPDTTPEKTFTQAELDEILEKRLARERRKLERYERQREIDEAVKADRESRAQPPSDDGPPQREAFDSLEDYLEAKAEWKVEQKFKERDARAETEAKQREERARAERAEATWAERAAKAVEQFADFEDVVLREDLVVTAAMAQVIKQSDNGVEVAYHLGKHPAEAARIAALDPVIQVYELGKLAASLKPETKPVSKAAQPIEPVRGGRSGNNDLYSAESFEQYRKIRLKQMSG